MPSLVSLIEKIEKLFRRQQYDAELLCTFHFSGCLHIT